MLTGVCQVIPPSVDRLNPPKSQAANSVQNWYWKPCPMLVGVLSTVNHSLSPLCAPPSLDCSTHDCPPSVERQISPPNVFTNRLRTIMSPVSLELDARSHGKTVYCTKTGHSHD